MTWNGREKVSGFSQTEQGYLSQPGVAVVIVMVGLKEDLEAMWGLLRRCEVGPGCWWVMGVSRGKEEGEWSSRKRNLQMPRLRDKGEKWIPVGDSKYLSINGGECWEVKEEVWKKYSHAKGFGFYCEHNGRALEAVLNRCGKPLGEQRWKTPRPLCWHSRDYKTQNTETGPGWHGFLGSWLIQLYTVIRLSCFGCWPHWV